MMSDALRTVLRYQTKWFHAIAEKPEELQQLQEKMQKYVTRKTPEVRSWACLLDTLDTTINGIAITNVKQIAEIEKSFVILEALSSVEITTFVSMVKASYFAAQSRFDEAIGLCSEVLHIAEDVPSGDILQLYALLIESRIYIRQRKKEEAFSCLQKMEELIVGRKDLLTAHVYAHFCLFHKSFGEYTEAFLYAEKSRELYNIFNSSKGIAYILIEFGHLCFFHERYIEAVNYFLDSLKRWREEGILIYQARVLNNLGAVYERIEAFDKALEHLLESLRIRRLLGDEKGEALTLNNIGNVCNNLQKHEEARLYLGQALAIFERLNDKEGMLSSILHFATNCLQEKLYAQALEFYLRSLDLATLMNIERRKAEILVNIGNIYSFMSEHESAEMYYRNAIALCEKLHLSLKLAVIFGGLGKIAYDRGNSEEGIELVKKGIKYCEEKTDSYLTWKLYDLLLTMLENKGDFQAALEASKKKNYFQVQEVSLARNMNVEFLHQQFAMDELMREKLLLQTSNQRLELELREKSNELATKSLEYMALEEKIREACKEITALVKNEDKPELNTLTPLIRKLSDSIHPVYKQQFDQQVKHLDHEFIARIAEQYSALSPVELKVCSLLRLNLSSKDIAEMLTISLRAVETYRYRIRRKMNLSTEDNLVTILMQL